MHSGFDVIFVFYSDYNQEGTVTAILLFIQSNFKVIGHKIKRTTWKTFFLGVIDIKGMICSTRKIDRLSQFFCLCENSTVDAGNIFMEMVQAKYL